MQDLVEINLCPSYQIIFAQLILVHYNSTRKVEDKVIGSHPSGPGLWPKIAQRCKAVFTRVW